MQLFGCLRKLGLNGERDQHPLARLIRSTLNILGQLLIPNSPHGRQEQGNLLVNPKGLSNNQRRRRGKRADRVGILLPGGWRDPIADPRNDRPVTDRFRKRREWDGPHIQNWIDSSDENTACFVRRSHEQGIVIDCPGERQFSENQAEGRASVITSVTS